MHVLVTSEHRFLRTPEGVWTQTMFGYSFWRRYLEVFDGVKILARAREVPCAPSDWERVDGTGVSFLRVPYYVGPGQYVAHARSVVRAARAAVSDLDAVILRVPSRIAAILDPALRGVGHPYGVEVVGDPLDVFSTGAVRHPLRPLFRWWFVRELRRQCRHACAVAYVTEAALQRRYPPDPNSFVTYCSDVELPREAFASSPRVWVSSRGLSLVFVGTLQHMYKGPDVLISAFASCIRDGLHLRLVIVGDGQYRGRLEAQAVRLGVGDRVVFTGQLSKGPAVREWLDRGDLFVLPSRADAMPRAMLEAMARGLPCIGSEVGGIPELLPGEDLVPPGDVGALAAKIKEVVRDPQRMTRMSQRNLAKAHQYAVNGVRERRLAFYRYVRAATESWHGNAAPPPRERPRGMVSS